VHTHSASETFYVLTGRGAVDLARARPVRVVDRVAACPLVRLCSLINTSNTAPTAPQLRTIKIRMCLRRCRRRAPGSGRRGLQQGAVPVANPI
jgi:hypothetical protein